MKEQQGCYGGEIKINSLPQGIWTNNVRILLIPSTNFQVYGPSYLTYTQSTAHLHSRTCSVTRPSEAPAAGRLYFGVSNMHTEGISIITENLKAIHSASNQEGLRQGNNQGQRSWQ